MSRTVRLITSKTPSPARCATTWPVCAGNTPRRFFLTEIADLPLAMQVRSCCALAGTRGARAVGAAKAQRVDDAGAVGLAPAAGRRVDASEKTCSTASNVGACTCPHWWTGGEDIPLLRSTSWSRWRNVTARRWRASARAIELAAAPGPGAMCASCRNVVENAWCCRAAPIIPLTLVQRALSNQGGGHLPFDEARGSSSATSLTQLPADGWQRNAGGQAGAAQTH